ncbi:MAG TPA: S1/P1 nuclease [Xanthomonadaceae bacterium]|nr:S1/P1 nuclease [Xanthomonadaceae bacterium]
MRPVPCLPLLLAALLSGVAALAVPSEARAWSALGHRLTGELAERHLDPVAAAAVARLLSGEEDPSLSGVAYWADALRNEDPERFKATSKWHYVNYPNGSCDFVPARDCEGGDCVIGAIQAQQAILADRTQPLEARRDALKFLVHFLGDAHQPMHAGNRGDLGGNRFQVSLRTDLEPEAYARKHYVDGVMGTNLHSIWDFYILGTEGLDLDAYADRLDALPWPPEGTPNGTPPVAPVAWAFESCNLLDSRDIYPSKHTMDHGYLDAMRPLAEQRVRQGAWRLAQLLNATIGQGTE